MKLARTLAIAATAVLCGSVASAHSSASCSQMSVARRLMQREIDGLRSQAARENARARDLRASGKDASSALASAALTAQRADVEQQRTDSLRHNVETCERAQEHHAGGDRDDR